MMRVRITERVDGGAGSVTVPPTPDDPDVADNTAPVTVTYTA
ncbi:hypothetical protein ACGF7W_21340 [Streptomyces sp. NPDC048219]